MFISNLNYPRNTELEMRSDGMETVPGYIVKCKDGHSYLVFAPDMDSVKHMHAYSKLMRSVKTYMSDHDYDPVRKCISPAWSYETDERGDYKVFHAPAYEMGKIFVVD